jgi:hypothetical protein
MVWMIVDYLGKIYFQSSRLLVNLRFHGTDIPLKYWKFLQFITLLSRGELDIVGKTPTGAIWFRPLLLLMVYCVIIKTHLWANQTAQVFSFLWVEYG